MDKETDEDHQALERIAMVRIEVEEDSLMFSDETDSESSGSMGSFCREASELSNNTQAEPSEVSESREEPAVVIEVQKPKKHSLAPKESHSKGRRTTGPKLSFQKSSSMINVDAPEGQPSKSMHFKERRSTLAVPDSFSTLRRKSSKSRRNMLTSQELSHSDDNDTPLLDGLEESESFKHHANQSRRASHAIPNHSYRGKFSVDLANIEAVRSTRELAPYKHSRSPRSSLTKRKESVPQSNSRPDIPTTTPTHSIPNSTLHVDQIDQTELEYRPEVILDDEVPLRPSLSKHVKSPNTNRAKPALPNIIPGINPPLHRPNYLPKQKVKLPRLYYKSVTVRVPKPPVPLFFHKLVEWKPIESKPMRTLKGIPRLVFKDRKGIIALQQFVSV